MKTQPRTEGRSIFGSRAENKNNKTESTRAKDLAHVGQEPFALAMTRPGPFQGWSSEARNMATGALTSGIVLTSLAGTHMPAGWDLPLKLCAGMFVFVSAAYLGGVAGFLSTRSKS